MTLTLQAIAPALGGGVLIGLATALMLLGPGRIAGISGSFYSALAGPRAAPRLWFLVGLLASAIAATLLGLFDAPALLHTPQWPKLIAAGLLVGFGTQLGGGCTSGHGLCGIANGSGRGFVATLIFFGVATLVVLAGFGGLS